MNFPEDFFILVKPSLVSSHTRFAHPELGGDLGTLGATRVWVTDLVVPRREQLPAESVRRVLGQRAALSRVGRHSTVRGDTGETC